MRCKRIYTFFSLTGILFLIAIGLVSFTNKQTLDDDRMLSYIVDIKSQNLSFYWKDDSGKIFGSILDLKNWLDNKHQTLVFAMNGGMFKKDLSPLGLYIQEQKMLTPLDTSSGKGNFYLKPNGVFYITTDKQSFIRKTTDFIDNGKIQYATQSGPMLLIN
jgi:uncharacterized protein YigE (DUF2233 family)